MLKNSENFFYNGHLVIVGSTASGKSSLAMGIGRSRPVAEIISIDSMAIYKNMDIGTATPSLEEQKEVRHHLLNLVEPCDEYAVPLFQSKVYSALDEITERKNRAVLVGGTGLHLRTVVDGFEIPPRFEFIRKEIEQTFDTENLYKKLKKLDPVASTRIDPANRRRIVRALEVTIGSGKPFSSFGAGLNDYPPSPFLQVGIRLPKEVVDQRIAERYKKQISEGFVEEVSSLMKKNEQLSKTASKALGYKQIIEYINGKITLEEAIESAIIATRQFARRQERWFRRDPRIEWLEVEKEPLDLLPIVIEKFDALSQKC